MAFDLNKYEPVIDGIISTADPDEISPKRIRKAIQQLYDISLEDHRDELKQLIIERYNDLQNNPKILITKKSLAEKDKKIASKTVKVIQKVVKRSSKDSKKTKKRKKVKEGSNSLSATNVQMSPQLQEFLGEKELPRTQVVKLVWNYIKEHDLQNPDDRREIICDDKMKPIFGEKMTMFSLNKILSKHLFKAEGLANDNTDETPKIEVNSVKSEVDI